MSLWLEVLTAASIFFMLLVLLPPTGLVTFGALLWSVNLSWLAPAWSDLLIVLSAGVFGVAAVKSQQRARRPVNLTYAPLAIGILAIVLAPASVAVPESLVGGASLLVLGLVTVIVTRYCSTATVIRGLYIATLVGVVLSLLLAAAGLPEAFANDRLRGFYSNANSMGILAFQLVALSFSLSRRIFIFSSALALAVVLLSASRGSALAVGVALTIGIWTMWVQGMSWRAKLSFGGALLLAAVFVESRIRSIPVEAPDDSLFRTGDSGRSEVASLAWENIWARPISGAGIGASTDQGIVLGHALPLSMGVQFGVAGLVAFVVVVVMLLKTKWRWSPPLAVLVFGSIATMISESWLWGAGSVLALNFWIAVSALATSAQQSAGRHVDGIPNLPDNKSGNSVKASSLI